MPRIPDHILDSVIYLYETEDAAHKGEDAGGTGFLVAIEGGPRGRSLYAVTNSHLVGGFGQSPPHPIIRVNKQDGTLGTIAMPTEKWIHHSDGITDLAVCPISLDDDRERYKYRFIQQSLFLSEKSARDMRVGSGDDVYLIGRFINHEGKERNLPSVRYGTIAQMPLEPVSFEGILPQEAFLVEVHSISGFSGSPIMTVIPIQRASEQLRLRAGPNNTVAQFLLGVDCGHLRNYEWIEEYDRKTGQSTRTDFYIATDTGMAVVIPAWKLSELLQHCEETEMKRRADMEPHGRPHLAGKLDVATGKPQIQKTRAGATIPVLTRDEFFKSLGKATRRKKDG
jgi:hypothetical protein